MLGALSALWEIIPGPPFDIPFPLYPRISWDLTGIPMMISLLLYGPLSAVCTCMIGCAIIFIRGNIFGGVFKLVAELATLLGFAVISKNFVLKSATAILSRVTVMTIANYYLLPAFYKMPEPVVLGLLAYIGVFNLTQTLIRSVPALIVFWRITEL